jgi:uncharacterized circularly permuted ATP-grasp superfamily protein/uncharacterized alpha-E superfamily protein
MSLTPEIMDDAATIDAWRGYRVPQGLYDEMHSGSGEPRAHWQTFVQSLNSAGLSDVARRWEEARRLIHENGVTYNIHGDPRGLDRPWELDPIPLLISASEWEATETGLVQRARLLEAILADLYGSQRLLNDGLLPPDLVFGHRGFLHACHSIPLPSKRHLHLYAADLGRSPDGQLAVIADRTQALSGAGYALENRIVLSRMWPDLFRDCLVQRLAMFFQEVREFLASLAPQNRDNPRVVLLTPGPYNETYFEHAYLARYLGYTLVEGNDLTVCDSRVFLKLLGGLQPVDVILRRLDDDLCDPLELRGDSVIGVPGLVQAVRAGNVAVANPLGSSLIETPAIMPFLPALCRSLLGEELRLPSVPSFWCGDVTAMQHVLTNLQRMVIKPSFPGTGLTPVFGESLSGSESQALADRIRSSPRDFVAQEQIQLSTAPILANGRLEPRHMGLRAFVAASDGSFTVMPGGLTRISSSADTLVVSITKGGGSKDTWVLSSTPVCTFSLLQTGRPVELSRGGGDLPSRVADNLFWLGRYAERAEGAVRLFRGILDRLTVKSGLTDVPELPTLLRALTDQNQTYPGFVGEGVEARLAMPDGELLSLLFNQRRSGSLAATLDKLHRVAGLVRDRISIDAWRILQSIRLEAPEARPGDTAADVSLLIDSDDRVWDGDLTLSDVLPPLNRMIISLAALGGIAMESMTRGHGWRFLEMGRRLERSVHLIRLLRSTLVTVTANEAPLLEALLEVADSSMTYRRRYPGGLQVAPVLDLLLTDATNPRSLAFQLVALAEHVENLPHDASQARMPPGQRIMMATLTTVRLADVEMLSNVSAGVMRPHLLELLARLEGDLPVFSDTISQHYLTHAEASRQLSSHGGERGA